MNEIVLITVLYISIIIHELGHLIAFRIFKISIKSYDIGIGMRLISFVKSGVIFNFKLMPIGGMVVPFEKDYEDLKVYKKLIIALSGVLANLLTTIVGLFIFTKGDINIFISIIKDAVILIKNFLSYDNLSLYDNSFRLLLMEEMNSLKSLVLNDFIIVNLVLFLINLLPIPPLDGSKFITEPLIIFFSELGVRNDLMVKVINILSIVGIIIMFIPKISNEIIIFLRDNINFKLILYIIILILICLLIYQIKTYKNSRKNKDTRKKEL